MVSVSEDRVFQMENFKNLVEYIIQKLKELQKKDDEYTFRKEKCKN